MLKSQIEIENENRNMMFTKSFNNFNKQNQSGGLAENSAVYKIINTYKDELTNKLQEFCDSNAAGEAKKTNLNFKILSFLKLETVSLYTVKIALSCTKAQKLTQVSSKLARFLETEFRLLTLEEKNKENFKKLNKIMQKRSYTGDRKLKFINDLITKYNKDIDTDKQAFLKLAVALLTILADIRPTIQGIKQPLLVSIERVSKRDFSMVQILPWLSKFVITQLEAGEFLTDYHTPLIEKPIDWTNLTNGGFHTEFFKYSLIKTEISLSKYNNVDFDNTLNMVNKLQSTKWRVNKPILNVIKTLMLANSSIGGLPVNEDVTKQTYPNLTGNEEEDKAKIKLWRQQTAQEYSNKISEDSKYTYLCRVLSEAQRFQDFEAIYFAYFLDFRGRAYSIGSNLNPQSSDYVKALLEFSEGKKITNNKAQTYFYAAIASNFGNGIEKQSLEHRAQWTKNNIDKLLYTAKNWFQHDSMFNQADESPFLFLAGCLELSEYLENPETFESRLVITSDGSCNGLQHLSAMLFDEVGGKSVNLLNNAKKEDIYTDVLKLVVEQLTKDNTKISNTLLQIGMDRKITKRPVMIVPYAGTKQAVRSYTDVELTSKGAKKVLGDDYVAALNYLTDVIWDSIAKVIIKGKQIMDYLSEAARIKAKQPNFRYLEWTTPSGFHVIQKCNKQNSTKLKTKLGDNIVQLRYNIDQLRADVRKHGFGIAPNFIHSLDATHMCYTVNGVNPSISFAFIHDSFGCHAADAEELNKVLRISFHDIYKDGDVLSNFIEQQGLTEIMANAKLEAGRLDLNEVLESEFFFS